MTTRLPDTAHTSRPWRIHELTRDFRVEDVWGLPVASGPEVFPRAIELIATYDPEQSSSAAVRMLFALRWKVGELFGWDEPGAGVGSRVPRLRDRLPADLRAAPSGPEFDALPFTSLYLLDDEFAAEIANETMHGVMHVGFVPGETGGYRGQLAVLVKAERSLRHRLHGRDQAVPPPARLPASAAGDGGEAARARRRSGAGTRLELGRRHPAAAPRSSESPPCPDSTRWTRSSPFPSSSSGCSSAGASATSSPVR